MLCLYTIQVLSGLLPVREPDMRTTDATENAQLETEISILPLDAIGSWHHPQLRPVRDRWLVLRPCVLRHCGFHLQIHRVQRVGDQELSLHYFCLL